MSAISWRNGDTTTKWGFGDGGRRSDSLCLTLEPTRVPADSTCTVSERRSQREFHHSWPDQLKDKAIVSLKAEGCRKKWLHFHLGQVAFAVSVSHPSGDAE